MGGLVKEISIMPHMVHLTTYRLAQIFHMATDSEDMKGVAGITYKILESRGLRPWELKKQYYWWHRKNWFYKTLLWFLKPESMKDENVLSPVALEIEHRLAAKRKHEK